MEALQLENERLQSLLIDAKVLLQKAHQRLSKLVGFNRDFCFFQYLISINILCYENFRVLKNQVLNQ